MEYKGIEYSVVQTACPTGWKWTARLPATKVSTGTAANRSEAVRLAQIAIEKAFAIQWAPNTPDGPERALDMTNLRQRYAELQRLREQVRELETTRA